MKSVTFTWGSGGGGEKSEAGWLIGRGRHEVGTRRGGRGMEPVIDDGWAEPPCAVWVPKAIT